MPSRTFTRAELIRSVYADHRVVCERTIDSHVKTLRRKLLRVHPAAAVRAIYGGGYRAEVGLTATVARAQ